MQLKTTLENFAGLETTLHNNKTKLNNWFCTASVTYVVPKIYPIGLNWDIDKLHEFFFC